VTAPDSHTPPVYACAAGAVVHAHSADTLEPALLLHTFLPPGVEELLRTEAPRVDVSGDGPRAGTVTVRVLAGSTSLSWSVPIGPVVAALPGQPGDDGRMVLLALVDSEPSPSFWSDPIDCERLAAELQLPVADVVEALHGRLTPWLADDLELLLHDAPTTGRWTARPRRPWRPPPGALPRRPGRRDGHHRAGPGAVARPGRLHRRARRPAVQRAGGGARGHRPGGPHAGAGGHRAVRDRGAAPAHRAPAAAGRPSGGGPQRRGVEFLLAASDRDETVRAAVSVLGRLARAGLGPTSPTRTSCAGWAWSTTGHWPGWPGLWVDLAAAASGAGRDDAAVAQDVAVRARAEGRPGVVWLTTTAATLVGAGLQVVGRSLQRIAEPVDAVRRLLDTAEPSLDVLAEGAQAAIGLARFVRSRARSVPAPGCRRRRRWPPTR
jgi:hypothetical protein